MAKEVKRLSNELVYNKPLLITTDNLQQICNYLEVRNGTATWKDSILNAALEANKLAKENQETLDMGGDSYGNPCGYYVKDSIAYIDINGTLTCKPTMFSALCGGCDYVSLQEAAKEISEDSGVKAVVLTMDSCGGEAYLAFETSRFIRDTLKAAGKQVITYVDGMMASAAYALGCCADEVIMNPDSQTGSIGVVVSLMDKSKALDMEGLKPLWVYAGDSKIPFADDGSFKQDFLDDLQASVDETYSNFVGLVSEMRGLSTQNVIDTQAKVFRTNEAISLGLADKSMTYAEFEEYLMSLTNATDIEVPFGNDSHEEDDHEEDEEDAGCGNKKKKAGCGKDKNAGYKDKKAESFEENINLNLAPDSQEHLQTTGEIPLENLEVAPEVVVNAEMLALQQQLEDQKAQLAELAQYKELAAKLEADKLAHEKAEHVETLSAYDFISTEQKESLANLAMTNKELGSMLFGVFASANAAIEEAAKQVMEVKDNFGKEQGFDTSVDAPVAAAIDPQEIINAKIAKMHQQ